MKKCPFYKNIQKCCFSCRIKYWPLSLSRQSKDLLHFWTCSGDGRLKTGELWQSPPMAVSVFLRRRNWNFFFMFLALKSKKKNNRIQNHEILEILNKKSWKSTEKYWEKSSKYTFCEGAFLWMTLYHAYFKVNQWENDKFIHGPLYIQVSIVIICLKCQSQGE